MHDISRRALVFSVPVVAAWPRSASAAAAEDEASPGGLRRLAFEVSGLTERFYRTAVRRTRFTDAAVGRYARELSADHGARLARLGDPRSAGAAAGGDWSAALDRVVGESGWRGAFDPFAGDAQFLLSAHVLESATADALRCGASTCSDLAFVAAEAGYHAGLVRTALAATAAGQAVGPHAQAASERFARLRDAPSMGGAPERRALRTLFLTSRPAVRGGFFPNGLQGPIRLSA